MLRRSHAVARSPGDAMAEQPGLYKHLTGFLFPGRRPPRPLLFSTGAARRGGQKAVPGQLSHQQPLPPGSLAHTGPPAFHRFEL